MHRARNTSQKRANPYDGSHGEKGGRYDIGQMAADDRVVHDRIGIGVPVRVFVGSAGENAYRIVRNGDQHHLDGVHRRLRRFDSAGEGQESLVQRESADAGVHRLAHLQTIEAAAIGGGAQRAQPYRWHGGAWTYHTVHMLQRDTADVYRRPCRIGCGTWGSRRFHYRFRRGDMVVVRDRHHSRLWRFVSGDMAGKKHRHRADDNRRGPDRHRHRDTGLMDSRSCP